MNVVLLAARILLALIFGIAGGAKASDMSATRKALAGFGVPAKIISGFGWALPALELATAVALIPVVTAWSGSLAALVLLVVFAAAIGGSLIRGRRPDCNCFGQLQSRPVSWSLFARNLLLAGVAAILVAKGSGNPGMSALNWLKPLTPSQAAGLVLGTIAVGILSAGVIYLRRILRQQVLLLEKLELMKKVVDEDYGEPERTVRGDAALMEGLPIGAFAPSFALSSVEGEQVTLERLLLAGKPTLLLFVSPNCAPCKILLPVVRFWERDYTDQLTVAVVSQGTFEETQKRLSKYAIKHLLLQTNYLVAEEYEAKWTPAAVLIGKNGRIASQVTYGDEAIRALVGHAVAVVDDSSGSAPRITVGDSLLRIGQPAPRFSLPDLGGRIVSADKMMRGDTLLVFWNPGCSFCQRMYEDIRAWEDNPPENAPGLVIVSAGSVEETKAKCKDFKSLVLQDPDFEIAPLFGSGKTPSAVLVDSSGRLASNLALGSRDVLALAGVRKLELPIASSF